MFGATGFGGTSLFGGATTAAPTFGASTFSAPSTSSPFTFGAPQQTTTTFGAAPTFGGTPSATPNLFSLGSASKTASTPLFGSSTTPSFGGTSSSIFGGSAGTTTSPFGGSLGTTGFGGTTPAFGAPTAGFGGSFTGKSGTGDPKFTATTGRDAGGTVIHQTITAMPAYESRSFEELRFEDYAAGRKGLQGQPQQSAGVFSMGATGMTGGGLFGASSQQTTSAFGLPSTTTTPSSGFSLFGTPAASSTGGGLFGASQPSSASSLFAGAGAGGSSLFGGSLGAPSSSSSFSTPSFGGSLFGASGSTPSFGSTPSTSSGFSLGGGLGGAPSFSLGGTDTSSSLFGGSSFGASSSSLFGGGAPASSSSSLFGGGSSSSLFSGLGSTGGGLSFGLGSSSASSSGSSLFGGLGSTPAPSFSLGSFGSSPSLFSASSSPSSQFSIFGSPSSSGTSLFGGSSLFGGTPSSSTEPHLISTIQSNPYGSLPSLSPPKGDDLAGLGALKSPTKKAIKQQPHYKLTPRSAAKIQPRGYGKKLSVFDDQPSAYAPSKVVASPDIFQSRIKLTIDPEAEMPEVTPLKAKKPLAPPQQSPYVAPSSVGHSVPTLSVTSPSGEPRDVPVTPLSNGRIPLRKSVFDPTTPPAERVTTDPATGSMASPMPKRVVPGTVQSTPFGDDDDEPRNSGKSYSSYEAFSKDNNISITRSPVSESNGSDKEQRKEYLPNLTKPGYYTVPDFEALCKMTVGELSKVRDFTVGRPGYGSITFKGETDVRGLNLDEIIVLLPHQIEVYPDGTEKPHVGKGLNKSAVVTLEKCWPKDPKTGKFIKEPSRRVERFIKKLRVRSGTKFVSYHVNTGQWSFEVDSF